MINYAGHLYDQIPNLAYTTIRGYIDGVRHEIAVKTGTDVLKAQRAPELDLRYKMVMRAIRRQRSGPRLVRTAVTLGMMRQLTEHPDEWFATKSVSACTIKAAQCTAFFALTRIGEITSAKSLFDAARNMTRNDVKVHQDEQGRKFITVVIKNAKTAIWGEHQVIAVYETNDTLCPVKFVEQLLAEEKASNDAPMFMARNGDPLTRTAFVDITREVLKQYGHSTTSIMSHSFRKGGATRLALAGVPEYIIKAAGRWKSQAYFSYIEATTGIFAGITAAMISDISTKPEHEALSLIDDLKGDYAGESLSVHQLLASTCGSG
jgi:hypothetical protein